MTRPRYLIDASSLVKALKEAKLVPLGGQALQWITVYEVLNALWKETFLLRKLKPEEADSLITDFTELLNEMIILEPRGLEHYIFRIAVSKGVTVYDSSYIALAAKYRLTLVTEDRKLLRTASDVIDVASLDDIVY